MRLDTPVIELIPPQLLVLQLFQGAADAIDLSLGLFFVELHVFTQMLHLAD